MFERRIPFQKGYFSKWNEDDLKDFRDDDNVKRKTFFSNICFILFCAFIICAIK